VTGKAREGLPMSIRSVQAKLLRTNVVKTTIKYAG
jgi:hypothetical protein